MNAGYGITAPSWDEPAPEEPDEALEFALIDEPEPSQADAVTDPDSLRDAHQRGNRAREIMESVQLKFLNAVKFAMDSSEPEYAAGLWLCLVYEALTKAFDAQVADSVAAEIAQLSRESAQAVTRIEVASRSAVTRIEEACARLEELSIKAARSAQEVDAMLRSNTSTLANALGGHIQTLLDQTRGCVASLASELQRAPETEVATPAQKPAPAPEKLLQAVVKKLFGIA